MLILGKAATNYARKEIMYAEDYKAVLKAYGDSDLTRAFKVAKDFGAPYVFLINMQKDQDYFDIIEVLKQNDFTYLVFATLMLSDTFQDVSHGGRVHSFFAYLLGSIGSNHNSTFIVTDKHASLYEDVDAFLVDMNSVQQTFYRRCTTRAKLENIIFVANNLEKYDMASVPLAAALCATPINKYPLSDKFGKAIFRIDQWDGPGDMAYFRSDPARETTVENLLNCMHAYEPEKVVFIDRILKYLRREMDFSEFKGRFYTDYQKLLFRQALEKYLESIKGFVITWYSIDSIEAYEDSPGTVVMVARIQVIPVNCLEKCSLTVEAEV
jgi:hypothetical protein